MKKVLFHVTSGIFLSSGLALVMFVLGCAAPHSNTRKFDEKVAVSFRNAETQLVQDHALIAGAEIIKVASELGVSLVKHLTKAEAAKYETTASASTTLKMEGLQPPTITDKESRLTKGGFFVFLRTVKGAPGLPSFNAQTRSQYASKIVDLLKLHLSDNIAPDDILKLLESGRFLDDKAKEQDAKIAFCAVGLVRQRETLKSLEIQLLGYVYGALKAKNSAFKVPFTKWHKTESKLTVALENPVAFDASGGKSASAGATFEVSWDREKAMKKDWHPEWRVADNLQNFILVRSKPIAVPNSQDLSLSVVLAESSNMKKSLEKAADYADKLKLNK